MKKLLLSLALITFANVSYAPFPFVDTLKVKQDSIHSETVEQYHLRMKKMGFDINSCKCKDCQRFKGVRNFTESKQNKSFKDISYFLLIFLMVLAAVFFVLIIQSFTRWVKEGSTGLS